MSRKHRNRSPAFKAKVVLAISSTILITVMATTVMAAAKVNRVKVRYVPPENPAYLQIYTELKQRGALEKLQKLLSPVRLPKTLRISLTECDGEADAFYEDAAITICYEYIEELVKNQPQETTAAGIKPYDTLVGPLYEVTLHEFAHALFDMLELPVFGREEDAADQIAAYTLLQFSAAESRRLIAGTAYAYNMDEKKIDSCRSMEDYANEHGTAAQRFFNILCIAYGSDKKLFSDIVSKGYLPKSRAEFCDEEYEQVQDAVDLLIIPHIDLDLAGKLMDKPWLPDPEQ